MYAPLDTCTCICIYTHMIHAHTRLNIPTQLYAPEDTCTCICIYTHRIHAHTHMYMHAPTNSHTYKGKRVHVTYAHTQDTRTHTHTHTYIDKCIHTTSAHTHTRAHTHIYTLTRAHTQDTRTPLYAAAGAAASSFVLNILFIYGESVLVMLDILFIGSTGSCIIFLFFIGSCILSLEAAFSL